MKATILVHWPGKDTLACDEHARKLVALGNVLGSHVPLTTYNGDAECTNCENEAKKKESAA
jgi:hypothetical protein